MLHALRRGESGRRVAADYGAGPETVIRLRRDVRLFVEVAQRAGAESFAQQLSAEDVARIVAGEVRIGEPFLAVSDGFLSGSRDWLAEERALRIRQAQRRPRQRQLRPMMRCYRCGQMHRFGARCSRALAA